MLVQSEEEKSRHHFDVGFEILFRHGLYVGAVQENDEGKGL